MHAEPQEMPVAQQVPSPAAVQNEAPLCLAEVISALSFAIDLTEGAVPGHALRTCVLGMRLAERVGISGEALNDLYFALLLKDIGCSSNAARVGQIVGGDDRILKAGIKTRKLDQPLQSQRLRCQASLEPRPSRRRSASPPSPHRPDRSQFKQEQPGADRTPL